MDIGDHHLWWYRCDVGMEGLNMKNKPAFPAMHFDLAENEHGMTLRDYFAAKAMQAFIASPLLKVELGEYATALNAYKVADAMLKAREA
jgi:hypothetical protein